MSCGGYKGKKRGKGRHTRLEEWFQATEAWATLKPGPRALYIELKRRFNGANNGSIRMSVREAADLLSVHRNTVAGYFADLLERGLIVQTRTGHLGFDGHGIASTWALCEMRQANGQPADLSFRTWTITTQNNSNVVLLGTTRRA